jgi:hypothetical protein
MVTKEEVIAKALEVIPREQCVTIEELCLYLPIKKGTFYAWDLNDDDSIKAAINEEKVKVKQHLRRKWRDSDNATLQVAELKLCANEEELDVLSTNRVKAEVSMNRPAIEIIMHGISPEPTEEDPG